jgi:DNA-binding NtrC family response regulator
VKDPAAQDRTQGILPVDLAEPLAAIVRVKDGDGRVEQSLHLGPGVYKINASPDADLVIDDTSVSRSHLEVTLTARGVHIRDTGSRNGTFYLGQKVGEITLDLGSRLTIGKTELEFIADQDDFEGTQGPERDHYGALHGRSPSMRRLFTLMRRLEGSTVSVLIEGESGTGKELVARALHEHSEVKDGPFIAVNCGALDRALVRTELFGHKKGAFTGALGESKGAFAEADGGTLFLDEIGELPLDIQPVLLRALETNTTVRVGESKGRPVRVRVIAATHRTLKDDAEAGIFRSDLYYRLMVVRLSVPPLRERPEDIPLLAARLAEAAGLTLSDDLVKRLSRRAFPGNVRELRHAILAFGAIGELSDEDVPREDELESALRLFVNPDLEYSDQKEALVEKMTRIYLERLIQEVDGNRSEAARRAGLQRGYLRRLLEKYELD